LELIQKTDCCVGEVILGSFFDYFSVEITLFLLLSKSFSWFKH